ncbi:MAG: hypothetical protein HYR92_04805 [Burkholderiales bacterium]|nr:hypothetical protein [Burkholderiales bacterium]
MTSLFKVTKFSLVLFLIAVTITSKANETPLWKRPQFEQLKHAENKLKEAESSVRNDPKGDPLDYLNSPLQKLGTVRTLVGDAYGGMESFDRWMLLSNRIGTIQTGDVERLQNSTVADAIDAIVTEAKSRQIVILNEAHQMPLHRAFAMRLARELRKIGYEYLACETLGENFESGYLKQSTGYYSKEPMYANFLRDAAKDGWKFVPYEVMNIDRSLSADQMEIARESGQASNIIAATFKLKPKTKVFIYVGHGHGMKLRTDSSQTTFMAEYLQNLTQINPLSIDQTSLYEHSAPKYNHPLYTLALQKQNQQKAFVLKSANTAYEVFARYRDRVDMQVIHPSYGIDPNTHRFEWLSSLAELSPRDIPENLLPKQGRRAIYAFRVNEGNDAVPVDAVIVEAGKPIPKLMLPKAEFRFEFEE